MKHYRIFVIMLLTFQLANSCANHAEKKVGPEEFETTKKIGIELSLRDLLQTLEMNWDQLDDFTTSNGFIFDKYDNKADEIKFFLKGKNKLAKTIAKTNDKSSIAYTFQSQTEYSELKKQLVDSDFKFTNQKGTQETNFSIVSLNYLKKPFQAQLISFQEKGVTDYTLLITKYY